MDGYSGPAETVAEKPQSRISGRQFTVLLLLGFFLSLGAVVLLTDMAEPVAMPTGQITASLSGQIVRITGIVNGLDELPGGHLFMEVTDGSGLVRVLVWTDTRELLQLKGIELKEKDRVTVTGLVQVYRGVVEIVPRGGGIDVAVGGE